jgi:translocation and assembly module TamB
MRVHGVSPPATNIEPAPRGRAGRTAWWMRRVLAGLALVAVVAVAVVVLAAGSLDRPWLKGRVQALVRASGGVDVDYRALRFRWLSGLEVDDLVVRSPPELRALAPDLLRAGRLEARWSLSSLLRRGPGIERLAVSDVAVAVVVDELGHTSFDALSAPSPRVPAVPLSRQAGAWLGAPPPVGQIDVARVALAVIRTDHGRVIERDAMDGVALTMSVEPAAAGWRVHAAAGSPASPLGLALERSRDGLPASAARASLWASAVVTPRALNATVDLRVLEQSFVARLGADDWLHVEASARFDPDAHRTEITLDRLKAAGGAATAEASLELPDSGDPLVRHAHGDIDLARLLAWAPPDLVPVTVERGRIRFQIDSFVAGSVPRLAEGGAVAVDVDVSSATLRLAAGPVAVEGGTLSLHGQPGPGGGMAANGSARIAGVEVDSGNNHVGARDLAVDIDGQQAGDGSLTGRVALRFGVLEARAATALTARDGRCELHVDGLHADAAEPLATRGDLALSVGLASLDVRSPGSRTTADRFALRAHTRLEGAPPYAAEVEASASRARVFGGGARPVADGPASAEVRLHDVFPDAEHPLASRGVVHAALDCGEGHLVLDATKAADSVDYALHARAGSMKAARPFLPAGLARAGAWDPMAVAVRSNGHVERLGGSDPELRQDTEILVDRLAFGGVAARSLSFTLRSKGTALHQEASAELQARALALDDGAAADDHVALSVTLDREHPSLRLHVETAGRAAANLSASLSFDRSRRAVVFDVDGRLAGLAPLAPVVSSLHGLEGFDLSKLELGIAARGALLGVVAGVGRDGAFELEPHPTRTAGVEGTVDAHIANLRWARGDTALVAPAAAWHGELHVAGARRTVQGHFGAAAVRLGVGHNEVDLSGVSDDASAVVTGDLADPETELTQRVAVQAVQQDFLPDYPVGDVALTASVQRDPDGLVHVSEMKIFNGAGGTEVGLTAGVDLGAGRRRMSLTADLAQDLASLSSVPDRFAGRGKVRMEAKVESADMSTFRTLVDVKIDDVHVRMPRAGVDVESVDGEIPIAATFEVRKAGKTGETAVTMRRDGQSNPYSMLRFADQHALVHRGGFISIASLKTPLFSIAPLAGNLDVDQNVVSLRQFEMGIRGGQVTGQCSLDWDGPKSTLELHVRANGVQSSHGEPFDGNIAVVIAAGDRTVEGRAEILRIGRHHLLDLLDMQDPMRADAAMNRIRGALGFGYPKRLRLAFDHGFASARLELGGLASLVSIDELRGIPMGPIVDKFVARLLDTKERP